MSIVYKKGFFSGREARESGTELFMHGCNALGVMGAGVAAMVVKDFPWAFNHYEYYHVTDGLKLGKVYFADHPSRKFVVANAITQKNVGMHKRQGNYDAIYRCLESVRDFADEEGLEKLAMVKIGCGLAGCEWDIVESMVKHFFADSRAQMTIYHID